jgi:small subunit ribosomal protein S13
MVIFFGLQFSGSTRLDKALLSISGIGRPYAAYLYKFFGFSFWLPLKSVPREQLKLLVRKVSLERSTSEILKRDVANSVKLKIQLKTYKGIRHLEGLPVRGQNTKSNASTSRRLKQGKKS